VIELVIASIRAEAGAPLRVTVVERYSPRSCALWWERAEVEPGFVAALQDEARLETTILVRDAFFTRTPRQQRAEFVARLRRAISRQAKPSPWGRYQV
jgi:hypothetical protein